MKILILALFFTSMAQAGTCDGNQALRNVPSIDAEVFIQNSHRTYTSFTHDQDNRFKNFMEDRPELKKAAKNFFQKVSCSRAHPQTRAFLKNYKRLNKHQHLKLGLFIRKLNNGKYSYELVLRTTKNPQEKLNEKHIAGGNTQFSDIHFLLSRPLKALLAEEKKQKDTQELADRIQELVLDAKAKGLDANSVWDELRTANLKQEFDSTEESPNFIGPRNEVSQE